MVMHETAMVLPFMVIFFSALEGITSGLREQKEVELKEAIISCARIWKVRMSFAAICICDI